MKKKIFIEQWDKGSKAYSDMRNNGEDKHEDLINFPSILSLLGNIENKKLLDAGSGNGAFTYKMLNEKANVIGVDASKEMVKLSTKLYPNIEFSVQDLEEKFKFSDNAFDAIVCKYVLMFIENPEVTLKEFRRILKKNGVLVISIPHPTYWTHHWLAGYWKIRSRKGFDQLEGYFKIKKFNMQIKESSNLEFTFIYRPLSWYFNLFVECGFNINRIEEPEASFEFLKLNPNDIARYIPKAINFKLIK